jgi:hypothetical protein
MGIDIYRTLVANHGWAPCGFPSALESSPQRPCKLPELGPPAAACRYSIRSPLNYVVSTLHCYHERLQTLYAFRLLFSSFGRRAASLFASACAIIGTIDSAAAKTCLAIRGTEKAKERPSLWPHR